MFDRVAKLVTKHGLRAVLSLSALSIIQSFGVVSANAGTFQIAPILAKVGPDSSSASFRLRNPSAEDVTVQVSAHRWEQIDNESVLQPADELIVVPPLVGIPAGATQVVRIARRERSAGREHAYRVHFQEVPSALPEGFVGLQTQLKLDVPLFFTPREPHAEIEWRAVAGAEGTLRLDLTNVGNHFVRFSEISLRDQEGRNIRQVSGPEYALAGAQRSWRFEGLEDARSGSEFVVVAESGAKSKEISLTVE